MRRVFYLRVQKKKQLIWHFSSLPNSLNKSQTRYSIKSLITPAATPNMFLDIKNTYHPFSDSQLGIYISEKFTDEIASRFVLENVDLYYQPVQDPEIGIAFFFSRLIFIVAGLFVQGKVFAMVKTENGLVTEVTKLNIATMMIAGPFWLAFITSADFIHPLNEVIGEWFCVVGWVTIVLSWEIMFFNSFIVAVMRYIFIIHDEKVKIYGKQKARKIFLLLSFLIPFLLVVLIAIENSELHVISFINKCYGVDHKVFLADTSTLPVAKHNFCEFNAYEGTDFYGNALSILRRTVCIAKTIVFLFMGFNFFEGIIYYKIWSHINRYKLIPLIVIISVHKILVLKNNTIVIILLFCFLC